MTWVATGRVKAYADEAELFIRACQKFADEVKRIRPDTEVRFERGDTIELGTRGFFTKRRIVQIEYSMYYEVEAQGPHIKGYLDWLGSRLS